jgi:hypothetical protein
MFLTSYYNLNVFFCYLDGFQNKKGVNEQDFRWSDYPLQYEVYT